MLIEHAYIHAVRLLFFKSVFECWQQKDRGWYWIPYKDDNGKLFVKVKGNLSLIIVTRMSIHVSCYIKSWDLYENRKSRHVPEHVNTYHGVCRKTVSNRIRLCFWSHII